MRCSNTVFYVYLRNWGQCFNTAILLVLVSFDIKSV